MLLGIKRNQCLSENRNSFLRLLKNKGFKDERMTKVGLCAIGQSTTLESNKSLALMPLWVRIRASAWLEATRLACDRAWWQRWYRQIRA
jgi:hypothetical protein